MNSIFVKNHNKQRTNKDVNFWVERYNKEKENCKMNRQGNHTKIDSGKK